MENGFNDSFIPLVSIDLMKYNDISNNLRKNIITGKITGEEVDFIKQLDDLNKIYQKYKKDSQLDYDNKIKEIDNILKSSEPKLCNSFYQSHLIKDTKVLENFEEHTIPKTMRLLGEDFWVDENGKTYIS